MKHFYWIVFRAIGKTFKEFRRMLNKQTKHQFKRWRKKTRDRNKKEDSYLKVKIFTDKLTRWVCYLGMQKIKRINMFSFIHFCR